MEKSPKLKLVIHRFPVGEVIVTSNIFEPTPTTPPVTTKPITPPSTPIIPYRPPREDEE
ncbi:MAG: hypothetical protein J6Z79_06805 [Clostridia bacterium]|nr:hypothetical protein [Clostridia bacterium]